MEKFDVKVKKSALHGTIRVPASKSHTIRAITVALMCNGEKCVIRNPLPSRDCHSAMEAAALFGAECTKADGVWTVQSAPEGPCVPRDIINAGNSGSVMYFMTPLAATLPGYTVFTGDASIRKRPMDVTLNALQQLGCVAECTVPGAVSPPCFVKGPMRSGTVRMDGTLSQCVSGILLAAAGSGKGVRVEVDNPKEIPYLNITLWWFAKTGITVHYDTENYTWFEVPAGQSYTAFDLAMPGDWSSAGYAFLAGTLPGSEITIENMDFSDPQGDKRVADVLTEMGADIEKDTARNRAVIRGGRPLHGIYIDMSDIPDALPALSVAAAMATGDTVLDNIAGARLKETDRAHTMAVNLQRMGVSVEEEPNRVIIHGTGKLTGAEVDSCGDHRIAMSLTIAGLFADGETTVRRAECADVTFPGFYKEFTAAGGEITQE